MTLEALTDRFWNAALAHAPTFATVIGVHDFDDQLTPLDETSLEQTAATFAAVTDEAEAIDDSTLTTQQRITRELLIYSSRTRLSDIERRFNVAPIDPYLGPHTRLLNDTRQNTVADSGQADALLHRYERIPTYLEEAISLQRLNAEEGMTPAMASLERVFSQLDGYLTSSIDTDPFLALDVPGDGEKWHAKAEALVASVIRPAFEEYRAQLQEHLAPVARPDEKSGLMWITNGDQIYRDLVYKYTQLDKTPEEIHEIGLEWATEINAKEWVEIGRQAFGLSTIEEIFERLHSDPDLRFRTADEMVEHAERALERAWGVVDDWFGTRPTTPCTVKPVPEAMAPAMPPAYYMSPPLDGSRPGTYFINTYKPEERDLFEYESIHFHEGIPGHHFDRSLAAELEGLPPFRRYAMVYAHTEGWGLYSERLADEMGLYSSDIDRLGMISADAWRAGRLVTDTGIHAMGWSRQQAIDFLQKWTPIGLLTIEQEVDRYIGMSGQALSYKMGQLEIMRLRQESEKNLGDRFDIKGFHDTMLIHGAMPLPLLGQVVQEWESSI